MARTVAILAAFTVAAALGLTTARAQNAAYFSPTFAASEGSPYSEVYARAFGSGGPANRQRAEPLLSPPLVTAAPPAAAAPSSTGDGNAVVYVIEDGQLLTYQAGDFAAGTGAPIAAAPLPAAGDQPGGTAQVRVPTVADSFYEPPPLETAAGPTPEPIRLIPPAD